MRFIFLKNISQMHFFPSVLSENAVYFPTFNADMRDFCDVAAFQRPGASTGGLMECAREGAQCLPIAPCAAADGTYTVMYGLKERKTVTVSGIRLPASCNVNTFKKDPVPGAPKNCWVQCGR